MSNMIFKVGNDIDINFASLQGELKITYKDLVKVFGEPSNDGDQYKIDAEWVIQFEDGTVATIYNWKDGHNYNEGNGLDVCYITNWRVGGRDKKALGYVVKALKDSRGLPEKKKELVQH